MPITVNSFAIHDSHSELVPYKLTRRDLLADDVLIDIEYTGICHSDLHVAHNDWHNAKYPIVTGHEIVGRVAEVGSAVGRHKVGDMVAVGCFSDSCGHCEQCVENQEMFCENGASQTYNDPDKRFPGHNTAGGYSEKIVVQEKFVLKVPAPLQKPELLPGVAPILCAGITMYSPLRQFGATKGKRVGIVGLGGLGGMGLKLAHALGAEVGLISRSHKKDAQAKQLGADRIVASSSEDEMKQAASSFDIIIDTIPWDHDIEMYMPLLKPFGVLSIVGYLGKMSKPINTMALIAGNKRVAGSLVGGIKETQELLDLCGQEEIIADFDLTTMDKVNDAWKALTEGDVPNRFVIDIKQFAAEGSKA